MTPVMASIRMYPPWSRAADDDPCATMTPSAKSAASTTESELAIVALRNGAEPLESAAPATRERGIASAKA